VPLILRWDYVAWIIARCAVVETAFLVLGVARGARSPISLAPTLHDWHQDTRRQVSWRKLLL
jgi:hypothetical protein